MFHLKRRFQNFEENLLENTNSGSLKSKDQLRKERLKEIRENLKNFQILGFFAICLLGCLFVYRYAINSLSENGDKESTLNRAVNNPPYSLYGFDFPTFKDVFAKSKPRDSKSRLPQSLESLDLCDFDRVSQERLTEHWFESSFRNNKPLIIFFDNDLADWSTPQAWKFSSLNRTYGKTVVQFGKSLDSTEELRESSFSNFLANLLGQTDLRGEPWQMQDYNFFSPTSSGLNVLKEIRQFKGLWKNEHGHLRLGTTLSGSIFRLNPVETIVGVIKGRSRFFLYPPKLTPPGGYEPGHGILSWYSNVYTHLDPSMHTMPLECIIEPGELLYIPEAWFYEYVNVGTTLLAVFEGAGPVTDTGKLLRNFSSLSYEEHSKKTSEQLAEILSSLAQQTENSDFVKLWKARNLDHSGRPSEAQDILEQLPSSYILAKVEQARILREKFSRISEAARLLNATLELSPQSDLVYRELGICYHYEGLYEAAGDAFRGAALLASQVEQQLEDLNWADDNFRMAGASGKQAQTESIRKHFKQIAKHEYSSPYS